MIAEKGYLKRGHGPVSKWSYYLIFQKYMTSFSQVSGIHIDYEMDSLYFISNGKDPNRRSSAVKFLVCMCSFNFFFHNSLR